MNKIILESHNCKQRFSYKVTFEGPGAEDMALKFIEDRSSTHAVSEWIEYTDVPAFDEWTGDEVGTRCVVNEQQPHMIEFDKYPRLYKKLNPTCEHGMSAWSCYGPAHDVTESELAAGW